MAAVPVVNNLLAQRPFFMIKIHRPVSYTHLTLPTTNTV